MFINLHIVQMKKYLIVAIICLFSYGVKGQRSDTGTLRFATSNFSNDQGKAVLFLFRKSDKIPDKPFMTVSCNIERKMASILLPGIAFGNYAAILLHDENSNGRIDHSFGLPFEQLGYSNNWKLGFFTGMPTFSKLEFQFSPASQNKQIKISYKTKKIKQ